MARNFAAQAMESQKKEFMSWGIMGDWDTPYTTMAPDFVKNQMKIFLKLYQNGTLFQRYMLSHVNIYKSQDERKFEFYEREIKIIELNSRRFLNIKPALNN